MVLQNGNRKLKYDQKNIQLDFVTLGLFNANENEYKYRLKGFETNWQTTHNLTEIKYFPEPGKNEFEISCTPPFSPGKVYFKTFSIIIAPPWWHTWWFMLAMIIIFAGLIMLFCSTNFTTQASEKIKGI